MLHSRLSPRSLSWKLRFLLKPGTLHADFSFSLKKDKMQGIGSIWEGDLSIFRARPHFKHLEEVRNNLRSNELPSIYLETRRAPPNSPSLHLETSREPTNSPSLYLETPEIVLRNHWEQLGSNLLWELHLVLNQLREFRLGTPNIDLNLVNLLWETTNDSSWSYQSPFLSF